jgi:hypothetical protein
MFNADRELYDHPTAKNEPGEFDPDERCFPGGPFHDIEALDGLPEKTECDSHTPTFRCRHCGHVWCENPHEQKKTMHLKPGKSSGKAHSK